MPRHIVVLEQSDLAVTVEDYVRNRMNMVPSSPVNFKIDNGDSGDPRDSGPKVSAELVAVNRRDDASNLPPMSNKVEGGGHFGLG